jgi:glutamyl-tRNA synthetase
VNWALARRLGWTLHLRIEDLDTARVSAAAASTREDLRWLGVDWDGEPVAQSARLSHYERAMRVLADAGLVYESPHSRSEIREAAAALSAPHAPTAPGSADGAATPFPRALRPPPGPRWSFRDPGVNHRFRVDAGAVAVHDELLGDRVFEPAEAEGDFIVWTKGGVPAYQLAVAVDDALQGVTDVVRGADLLPSAALQTLVHRALGGEPPRWWHVPLVVDAEGRRLAKRRGDLALASLRAAGVPAARVVGVVAWWTGAQERLAPMEAAAFRRAVEPSMLRAWSERAAGRPPALDEDVIAWLTA